MWQLESVRTKTIYFNLVYFTLYFGRIQHCGCILCVPYKYFVEINVGRISIMVEDDQAPEFSLHVYTSFYSTIFGKCNKFDSFLLYLFSSYVMSYLRIFGFGIYGWEKSFTSTKLWSKLYRFTFYIISHFSTVFRFSFMKGKICSLPLYYLIGKKLLELFMLHIVSKKY